MRGEILMSSHDARSKNGGGRYFASQNLIPDFTIITVVYNGERYIESAIKSVLGQKHHSIEYIIIDGGSSDSTVEIIKKYDQQLEYWISEPDKGIYDGMNKGIRLARGKYVGILNSDDFYESDDILTQIDGVFKNSSARCVFAHVRFIDPVTHRTLRVYDSKNTPEKLFKWGFMPAHPTFFTYREDYFKYGLYKDDYKIAADYELLMRYIYKYRLSYKRIDEVIIAMRLGGASTGGIKSTIRLNKEIIRACRENGVSTNFLFLSLKYFRKIKEIMPWRQNSYKNTLTSNNIKR